MVVVSAGHVTIALCVLLVWTWCCHCYGRQHCTTLALAMPSVTISDAES